MLSLLYECALWVFALIAFPRMLLQMWSTGKYKLSFLPKLGFKFPVINKGERQLIWVHAVSVGETKAVAALAKKLKNAPNHPLIVVSSATETGHADAKKSLPFADYHVYLPFDFSWVVKPIIEQVRPDKVILCETDWWYNFLRSAKAVGAEVIVVNGKISEKSKQRFQQVSYFSRQLFDFIDLFCLQSSHYQRRFEELGISAKKLVVTGNMKFDDDHHRLPEGALEELRERLALRKGNPVVVIGSTHEPEEAVLLAQLRGAWEKVPSMQVVVVPRHPERFNEVAAKIADAGFSLHRYTAARLPESAPQVVLVDAMGLLRKCYQLGTVAIVAGSFTDKVGGHNILEPLYYDVPTLFGPHMYSQPELVELALDYQAALQVEVDLVEQTVVDLLADNSRRLPLIEAGAKLVAESRGATNRTYEAVEGLSEKKEK